MEESVLRILPGATPQGVKIQITIEASDAAGVRGFLVDLLQGRVNVPDKQPEPAPEPEPVQGPFIQTPERIPSKTPTEVIINGKPRTVPACVVAILREIELGERAVCIRPEALAKFERHVPEIPLKRDPGRKVVSNRAWFFVSVPTAEEKK